MEESNAISGDAGEETPHLGSRHDSKQTHPGDTAVTQASQEAATGKHQKSIASSTMSDVKQMFFLYTTLNQN